MFDLIVFLISICVFFVTKSLVFNHDSMPTVYGGVAHKHQPLWVFLFIVSVPYCIIFGYILYMYMITALSIL